MPFLYGASGEVKLLFTRNLKTVSYLPEPASVSSLFREPWLSDSRHDASRKKIADQIKARDITIWKVWYLDSLDGEPVPANEVYPGFPGLNDDSHFECSPYLLQGKPNFIFTDLKGAQGVVSSNPRPTWTRTSYGVTASNYAIWLTDNSDDPIIQLQIRGLTQSFTIDNPYDFLRLYRIVPVYDQPGKVLITLWALPEGTGRTLLLDVTNPVEIQEVLVGGEPVYKSSLLGSLCAYVEKTTGDASRRVLISDEYSLVKPDDLKIRLLDNQGSSTPGVSLQVVSPELQIVAAVLDPMTPCPTPWCAELRAAYQAELESVGEHCTGCQAGSIRKKFAKQAQAKLKEAHV